MVVLLVGILAGAVLPMMEPSIHERLQGCAQNVVDDLTYCRSLAVTYNSNYRFTFDVASNRYYFEHTGANSALNTLPSSASRLASDPPNRQTTLVGGLLASGGRVRLHAVGSNQTPLGPRTQLEFRNWGETTQATETVIWLTSGSGTSQRYLPVYINPITGLATVGTFTGTAPASALVSGS